MAVVCVLALLVCILTAVTGQSHMCYDCQDVHHPQECSHMRKCHHDEVCYTELKDSPHGHLWNFHCRKREECKLSLFGKRSHHHPHPTDIQCEQCCDSVHGCNRDLCSAHAHLLAPALTTQVPTAAPTTTTTRVAVFAVGGLEQPFCYDCHDVRHPDECSHIRQCHHDEICFIEVKRTPHGNMWKFGCKKQPECLHGLFGKKKRFHPFLLPEECKECCNSFNGCNKQLCPAHAHTLAPTPSAHVSTAAPTTTTTRVAVFTVGGLEQPFCYDCHDSRHPDECSHMRQCHHEEICFTEVKNTKHGQMWTFGCKKRSECLHDLFGKHKRFLPHILPEECNECCNSFHGCNRQLCSLHHEHIVQPTTPAPVPTVAPTTTTTTVATTQSTRPTTPASVTAGLISTAATSRPAVYDPNCRDREEDGITCAMLDLFQVCTDPATLSYVIAHEKCPKHCRFCHSGQPTSSVNSVHVPPPTNGGCTNYEQDGFKCDSLDLFNICTDPSTLAYVLAHRKCGKHCGFCSMNVKTTSAVPTQPPITTIVSTTIPTTTISSTTSSTTPQPTTTIPTTTTSLTTSSTTTQPTATQSTTTATTQSPTTETPTTQTIGSTSISNTVTSVCKDVEENGFSCKFMDTFGMCTSFEPMIKSIAHSRCMKHCGLCR